MILPHNFQVIPAFPQIADVGAATATGDWIHLGETHDATLIFMTSGVTSQIPVLKFAQATAAAGTSEKALNVNEWYHKTAATDLTSTGTRTRVSQSSTSTVTLTAQGQFSLVEVPINQAMTNLDVSGGFDYVQCELNADPGGTAQPGAAIWIVGPVRYAQQIIASMID